VDVGGGLVGRGSVGERVGRRSWGKNGKKGSMDADGFTTIGGDPSGNTAALASERYYLVALVIAAPG
jgi:hypothetical protein